jgi:hypothetical protein
MAAPYNPFSVTGGYQPNSMSFDFGYKYDDPRENFNPWAYKGYAAQRGLVGRAYGQQANAATAAASQQAAQAGLAGPARQTYMQGALRPVQQAQAGEMGQLGAQYAQNLAAGQEQEKGRAFQENMQRMIGGQEYGMQGLRGTQEMQQLQFPYTELPGGGKPWEMQQQSQLGQMILQSMLTQGEIAQQQSGGGTPTSDQTLRDYYKKLTGYDLPNPNASGSGGESRVGNTFWLGGQEYWKDQNGNYHLVSRG